MSTSTSIKVLAEPSTEPLTLIDAKAYLRVDFSDDDALITTLISSARKMCEALTSRAWATQTVRATFTLDKPLGGDLSGPIDEGVNWYQYQQQLGANPFGPTAFYFDMPFPPLQSMTLIETQITKFDSFVTFTGVNYVDTDAEPGRVYFQVPPTVLVWRFTYQAGYNPLPYDYQQTLKEAVAFLYDHREADSLPDGLLQKLAIRQQVNV